MTSLNWGLTENEIKLKVETGTDPASASRSAKGADIYVKDDVARSALTIQYIGAGTVVDPAVTGTTSSRRSRAGPGAKR